MFNYNVSRTILFLSLSITWLNCEASVIPVNLNDFFPDPTVTVSADGSNALFEEDMFIGVVRLVNDPFFGDPEVIVAQENRTLAFEYEFNEGVGNDDGFSVLLFDGMLGPTVEYDFFETYSTGSGTVEFDLSSYVGLSLGLQFEMTDFGLNLLDSWVEVSNLRLVDEIAVVPIPASIYLFAWGLAIIGLRKRSA